MIYQYLAVGILLIIMGLVQIVASRRLSARAASEKAARQSGARGVGSAVWKAWSSVLGYIAVLIGVVLIVLGTRGN